MTDHDEQGGLFEASAQNPEDFDGDARREELLRRFAELPPEKARGQIAVLPYYHQLENEITKPNQGLYVTRYFLEKWAPSLGPDATKLVLGLRLCANQDGTTYASQTTIAKAAGLGLRAVQRWLSENPKALKDRSPEWRAQWAVLHQHFLKSKTSRYLIRREGTISRAKRTTSVYHIAMDDPVHPDDEGALFVKAAERIVREEAERHKGLETQGDSYNRPTGGNRKKEVIFEDSEASPYDRPLGGHQAPPTGRSLSLSERSNAINVKASNAGLLTETSFRDDPRVRALTERDRDRKDALATEIGDWLHTKAGKPTTKPHKSAGFHRRVAYFVPEELIRQVMRDLEDRLAAGRERSKSPVRDVSAVFGGFIRRVCDQKGIDLVPRPKRASEGQ